MEAIFKIEGKIRKKILWSTIFALSLFLTFSFNNVIYQAYAQQQYSLIKAFGKGQFVLGPIAIAVDSTGNIYVVDSARDPYHNNDLVDLIKKFSTNGTLIKKWGTLGTADGQFKTAGGIANDSSGNVFVTDSGNQRIQKFTINGTFVTKWKVSGRPDAIAIDKSGNAYVVVEDRNSRDHIEKFSTNGTLIKKWGMPGKGDGQFSIVLGIAVDPSGNVYIADFGNNIIQKFNGDGKFVTKIGTPCIYDKTIHRCSNESDEVLYDPGPIAVDNSGSIYVVDNSTNIKKFTSNGTFVTKIGTPIENEISGIAVDSNSRIYLTNLGSSGATSEVTIFSPVK